MDDIDELRAEVMALGMSSFAIQLISLTAMKNQVGTDVLVRTLDKAEESAVRMLAEELNSLSPPSGFGQEVERHLSRHFYALRKAIADQTNTP